MQVESAACDIPSWLSLDLLSTVRYLQYLRLQSEAGISLGVRVRMQLVVYERGIMIVQIVSALATPFLLSSPLVAKTLASRILFQTGMIIFAMSNMGLSFLGGHITYCVLQDLVTALRCQDGTLAIKDTKIYSATKRATKRLTMLFRLSVMMGVFDIGLLALSVSDVGLLLFKFALPFHIFFVQLFYAASRLAAKRRPKARDAETRTHLQRTKVLASNTSVLQHSGLQTSVLGPSDMASSFDLTRTSG
ncbi:Hypothetical Protein FCC1311_110372 [Hondaea fermentalgiana]|uniref:Uncharacterized protein n=1 Tax=Hondaea fermentalgiana TaxID=2315210 RepID=A0A2R5GW64_9STRA|nr:Hypothetical Protein FCC1311_110372 [Hondaea fermentalgiana]|eukprot:GBG34815.1 Hypothetical Protein FCC1311_110372 [Hondaea fermentalgiana]